MERSLQRRKISSSVFFSLHLICHVGSTGNPKGILHTTAGYITYAAITLKYVFDYHPGDVYACVADIGCA